MPDNQLNNSPVDASENEVNEIRARMELVQARLHAAKIAYLNRTEFDGKVPEYSDVAGIAKNLISLNYDLQRKLYGEVRLKLSVAKLLRASNR